MFEVKAEDDACSRCDTLYTVFVQIHLDSRRLFFCVLINYKHILNQIPGLSYCQACLRQLLVTLLDARRFRFLLDEIKNKFM